MDNYKGIYFDQESNEPKYYEGGAHFKYSELIIILENYIKTLSNTRRGLSEDNISNKNHQQNKLDLSINIKVPIINNIPFDNEIENKNHEINKKNNFNNNSNKEILSRNNQNKPIESMTQNIQIYNEKEKKNFENKKNKKKQQIKNVTRNKSSNKSNNKNTNNSKNQKSIILNQGNNIFEYQKNILNKISHINNSNKLNNFKLISKDKNIKKIFFIKFHI